MIRAYGTALIGSVVALVLTATPVAAQTVGTYSYFWTNTSGTPITSISANTSSTFTVQLRVQEGGGGNAFVTGIGAYDATVNWGQSGGGQNLFSFATSGGGTAPNPNIRNNPYATGGFNGPGAISNNATANINTNRLLNTTRAVLTISDPGQWVTQTTSPNTPPSILLMELTYTTGTNTGTTTVTGQQRSGQSNYLYDLDENDPGNTALYQYLDTAIGTNNAILTVDVVVPEPATVLGVCAAGLGVVSLVRRVRRTPKTPVPA